MPAKAQRAISGLHYDDTYVKLRYYTLRLLSEGRLAPLTAVGTLTIVLYKHAYDYHNGGWLLHEKGGGALSLAMPIHTVLVYIYIPVHIIPLRGRG